MASYNHIQHAPGEWNQHQLNHISVGDDMSIDPPPPTQKHSNVSHHNPNPNSMPPPPTTTAGQRTLSIEEGPWKGTLSMSIPRAVSHDQSDDMDVSQTAGSPQSYTSSSEGFDSSSRTPSTIHETMIPPTSVQRQNHQQQQQRLGDMSALTNRSTSTSASLSFAGMERYFNHNHSNEEDDEYVDVDGTAYYSAGSGGDIQDLPETPPPAPQFTLDTSVAISMSPSPVRSVGDIYDTTSLTPNRKTLLRDDNTTPYNHPTNHSEAVNATSSMDPRESTLPVLSVVHDDVASLPTYVQPSQQQSQQQPPNTTPGLEHFDASTIASNSIHHPTTLQTITADQSTTTAVVAGNPQNVFVLRGGSAQLSSVASSWQTTNSHEDESQAHNKASADPPSTCDSQSSGIMEHRSISGTVTALYPPSRSSSNSNQVLSSSTANSLHPEFSSWRSSSILVDSEAEEEEEASNEEEETVTTKPSESTGAADDSKAVFSLASGLAMPSSINEHPHLQSFDSSDPLYQLQQVSHSRIQTQHQNDIHGEESSKGIFSPLQAAPTKPSTLSQVIASNANNVSVNVSLGHYLSSASSDSQSADDHPSETEPQDEDEVPLSDIDVSRWSKESDEKGSDSPSNYSLKENLSDGASNVSAPSLEKSVEGREAFSLEATTTPRKGDLNLNPKDFSSPATTLRKNSLHISLEESTGYVARIDELEEELAAAQRAMKEQKDYYDEQMAQQHQFTMPLQPHSPFDLNNNQKNSPGTQQRKLLERNQTLLKEVRFADQTCVELSEQNSALEGKLQVREQQLEEMRQDHEDLTEKLLDSHRSNAKTEVLLKQMEQANEDKLGLERQLHAAYDKLEEKTKQIQALQDEHASELEELRTSVGNQNEGAVKHVQALREQIESATAMNEELKNSLAIRQRDLETVAAERDELAYQVDNLSDYKANYQNVVRERDIFREKAEEQLTLADRANRALQSTQLDLDETRQDLESARRESSNVGWKLKQAEQKLREVTELNDQQAAENKFAQEQVLHWKRQAEGLQKELDRVAQLGSESGCIEATPNSTLSQAQESEDKLHQEFEFVKKLESDMEEMNAALLTLTHKLEAQGGRDFSSEVNHGKQGKAPQLNPSFLAHLLASSKSSGGEVLSPQIVQILQLILSFTQQHLDVVDQNVSKLTSAYSERLLKLHSLVDHIRSSLVFESESDGESVPGNDTTIKENDGLDATFAAVTSVPDRNVERMEEARSPQSNKYNAACQKNESNAPKSPDERDTILDLSKIEAVNSPFYSSEITFSLENESDKNLLDGSAESEARAPATQKDRLQTVQRNVFRESLEVGKLELDLLRKTLSAFQQDFVLHRERLCTFVHSQQTSLRQLGDESSTLAAREARLVKERSELSAGLSKAQKSVIECNDKIRELSNDLDKSRRSEERLRAENDASRQRIATLQQDLVDVEYRLLSNNRRGPSRTNSFQERLEASISEQSSATETYRYELAEAVRQKEFHQAEMVRLQRMLKEAEEAHGKLKVSFVNSNEKLAAAIERTEHLEVVEKELQASKQREAKVTRQVAALEKQAQQLLGYQDQILQEKDTLSQSLKQAEKQNAILESKYQTALNSFDGTVKEQVSLQAKYGAVQVEMERVKQELRETLQTKEESRQQLMKRGKELEQKLSNAVEENASSSERIKWLEEAQRKSDESLNKLKLSYAACNDKLAEAMDRVSTFDKLVSDKEAVAAQLEASTLKITQLEETQAAAVQAKTDEMKQEIERLEKELLSAEDSHEKLKMTYVAVNERLANAQERLENQEALAKEKEDLEGRLRATEEATKSNSETMLNQVGAAQHELDRMRDEIGNRLKEKELVLKEARQESMALRSELADVTKAKEAEIGRLQEALQESEKSLDNLKISYAECNNKLVDAMENAAEKDGLAEKLRVSSQTEQLLRDELTTARKEQEGMIEKLRAAEMEAEESRGAVESLKQLSEERDAMRESIQATRQQLDDITSELGSDLKNTQLKLMQSLEESQHLRDELSQVTQQKASCETEIEFLELKAGDLEEALEKLKVSYVTCNDKLAAVLDSTEINQEITKELRAACEAAESLTESTEERLLECQNDLEDTKKERDDLLIEISEIQEELSNALDKFNEYKSSSEARETEMEDALEEVRNDKQKAVLLAQKELTAFVTELHSLRGELTKSLSLLTDEHQNGQRDGAEGCEQSIKEELKQLKSIVPSLCESISTLVDRLELSGQQTHQLNEEVAHFRAIANDLRSSLDDEKILSEELASRLNTTLSQVEFLSSKNNKLIDALDQARGAETDERRKAIWIERTKLHYENELGLTVEDKDAMQVKLLEAESTLMDLTSKFVKSERELSSYKKKAETAIEDIKTKEQALVELQSQKSIWENRCFKLREYMRKLTAKCEEWESSYAQQSKLLEVLHSQQQKTKAKAAELGRKYSELTYDVQTRAELDGQARDQLVDDLASFQSVHNELEDELDQIATELQNVSWSDQGQGLLGQLEC